MEKQVVIIGAGISGLLACKYAIEKGFNPIVFEAEERIGGVWLHTIESTKLQNSKETYQFSDFPWPSSVTETFPKHSQVMEYLESYAKHFDVLPRIRFNSRVNGIDYVGESCEEIESWGLWGGAGKPFGSKGRWHISVQNTKTCATEVYQAEFVILCIGQFSGLPNVPEFPPNQGPEVFNGKVLHSMDYAAMDNISAENLIKKKRVAIIGSHKSAVDIGTECANANGVEYPCTMIQRTAHWFLPDSPLSALALGFLFFNRFAELMVHKPGETFLLNFLATLLSPLRWGISKLIESYLRWKFPLKKYGMIPKHSFLDTIYSCQVGMLPKKFYEKVEEGGIILKRAQSFSFCQEGLVVDGEARPLETDVVIFATGYKGDEKLKNIFESAFLKNLLDPSSTSTFPLYRQVIHPRIPRLAVIGYSESLSNLGIFEIRCQWLAQLLDSKFELPSIRDMEKDVKIWETHIKRVAGKYFKRSCISNTRIWYNDQLCKDMGCEPRRKKGFFRDLFVPYAPADYAGLTAP
ncbi:probable flavin-containing monooxygenase 1 [Tripterygium wilfordii]|uniref:probable flavin-containing monooxygenase 1 n=1 Tax=Tripterygium wilfordii TaxID=458696 RepID=UPI0018F82F9C|nr:probable flavin-containing monooxygenase 1 [Tripterygium wilfordii]XP_038710974.1 probable flavin-containing monooxygenase 1 [Tripterygium wilfordii]